MRTLILDNNLNDVSSPQFSTKNIKEEEEYREAIDRYLRGNADMSLSSSNEVQFPFSISFSSSKV